MLAIGAASKKRVAGVGVKRPKKKAKPKRPYGTLFINYTCELDKDNCILDQNGLCIAHKTPKGNSKVKCLVNPEVATQLSCGNSKIKVKFKCDVCFHVFSIKLDSVTSGQWCGMCSSKWEHCGVVTCTFCFGRSIESYDRLTLKGKKKIKCIVNKADLRLALGSRTKVKIKCDVCFHVFSIALSSVTSHGHWCGMCSSSWEHCGVVTCTFCLERSFASYKGLTLNGKKKADCIVNKADLRLALNSAKKKVKFECDVCSQPFSMLLNSVINDNWCPTCKNKTELMVLNFLQDEMNIKVVTQYIPGGMKQMKKNYGKFGKMDFYLPEFNLIWELDGRQHNTQVIRFGNTPLFHRMILDKWKEYLVKKEGLNVIRFDQTAIWQNKYDWKQEMRNLLTLTSEQLTNQLKETKKRYKKYAKEHNNKSKRRIVPEIVKRSHAMFTKYVMIEVASKKRLATEGAGVGRPKKKAKPKRPRGTKLISFTCELDKDNCIHDENGLCIAHNTPAGKSKVKCLVNPEVAQLSCGCHTIVEMECDVCFHVFSITLAKVTDGRWCGMCSVKWKHCGVMTCTFCFDRSFASYKGVTLNGKKKVDCTVNKDDLRLSMSSAKKVNFECDVCFHVFSPNLSNVTSNGQWCAMCSVKWKHCGVMTCTYCFGRSFASYEGLTLNGKKKIDCIVDESKDETKDESKDESKDDLLLPLNKAPQLKSEVLHLPFASRKKVEFECDVCFHVFPIGLNSVTSSGNWCYMCSNQWKHCGADECTFCFERSFASYKELTLNGKKKVDCIVNKADLRLALGSTRKVDFECDICFHPFSTSLNGVTNDHWCPTCKNKTELMVLNFLQEMNIKVVTQYIPGGMKQMKKNYGKFGKLDFYLPEFNLIWELDGRQHNTQVIRFGNTPLFHRMILDKWKEYLVKKEGLKVIRFDQVAIWQNKYDWKQEMRNLLTFTSDKLINQRKETKKRYKMYAKQHNNKSKRRSIPEKVKRSHAMFTIMSFISKYK
jgi:very-short-patch-repair endonuclease